MATFPILYPSGITATSERLSIVSRQSVSTSAYSGHQSVVNNFAAWTLELGWFRMKTAKAERLVAFLDRLMGSIGSFSYLPHISIYPVPFALKLSTIGYATSTVCLVKGWTANASTGLRAGQYIQIGTQLHRVTVAPAVAAPDGTATVEIYPPLRADRPVNAVVETANPRGIFRLNMGEQGIGFQIDPDRAPEFLTVTAQEVI